MRSYINIYAILLIVFSSLVACNDLNLDPLSQGSSNNWYNNEVEINMSVNDLYKDAFWGLDNTEWTDDWIYRESLTPITSATINGEWGTINSIWANSYKAITRSNTLIQNLESGEINIPAELVQQYIAEAKFVRASQFAKLVSHFGDVVYFTNTLDLDEAYSLAKTDKETVLEAIYADYDEAIESLPVSYSGSEISRATKGAAMAFKARIALYSGDWDIARDAAKECMDLEQYSLYSNYEEIFYPSTGKTDETIFSIPRSEELNSYNGDARNYLPRNSGGWAAKDPSWDLLCAYTCTDGLPIDESPLFDPQNPFENRDPRCGYTIVPFQTPMLGIMYQPHPDSTMVLNVNSGQYQTNNDTRSNQQYASFNGLIWKKGITQDWSDNFREDSDIILMRYADVMLMYAEAKIELGEIDESVHQAINSIRARAYNVDITDAESYPAVTTQDQDELRRIIRLERRMEFALEGLRYMDLIRWRLAEKALNRPNYGMLDVAELKEKVVDQGLWFFPSTPEIDEDGIADFSEMADAGLIKQLTNRQFDASRQYLWPIPTKEVLINDNLEQNPGY